MNTWELGVLTGMAFPAIWLLLIVPCMVIVYRDIRRMWREYVLPGVQYMAAVAVKRIKRGDVAA